MTKAFSASGNIVERVLAAPFVSFIGSGGKTTLMYALGKLLQTSHGPVVCSTTTKLYSPSLSEVPWFGVYPEADMASLPPLPSLCCLAEAWLTDGAVGRIGEPSQILPGSQPCPHASGIGKVLGFSGGALDALYRSGKAKTLLVEADGSAGRPLKAPAEHEPVIPGDCELVVGVAGSCELYKPLGPETVWRHDIFAAISGCAPGEPVTPAILAAVLCHPQGGMFGTSPMKSRNVLFINTQGRKEAEQAAKALARQVQQHPECPVSQIYMGAAKLPEEAVCLLQN